eukprot:CAMPEP_0202370544 /NCGR_PEP_ID=MMETSP1127-20130417/2139_1 /ASSEMBLY_ACC=CAM_ASM_000462 /TAXON_ID=3047 /ORGANISM="Dunaliella tertiolecta, Strain CCMP1320" /LENGTH=147 /DNA_ID=CAMNT_0048966523 /DNA_START=621 /DNA_END=1063 /DNA_ORIENTATION=-
MGGKGLHVLQIPTGPFLCCSQDERAGAYTPEQLTSAAAAGKQEEVRESGDAPSNILTAPPDSCSLFCFVIIEQHVFAWEALRGSMFLAPLCLARVALCPPPKDCTSSCERRNGTLQQRSTPSPCKRHMSCTELRIRSVVPCNGKTLG